MVEAELSFRGHDLRDLFRPGSGLTFRRLTSLISGLGPESITWRLIERDREKALISPERQRQRAARYSGKAVPDGE